MEKDIDFENDKNDIGNGDMIYDNKADKNWEESEKENIDFCVKENEDSSEKEESDREGDIQDSQKLREEGEEARKDGEDHGEEGASASQKGEDTAFEETGSDGENGGDSREVTKNIKKVRSRGFFVAVIAVCVTCSLLLGACLGGGGVYFAVKYFDAIEDVGEDDNIVPPVTQTEKSGDATPDEENVSIDKNDGKVNVNENEYTSDGEKLSIVEVVEKTAASVVEVSTLTTSNYGQYVSSGAGSGVIIAVGDTYSYIVTNYHVIEGYDAIVVRLNDKREYTATYIDGDENMDIAVIKIAETQNIVKAKIGSSSTLKVGEGVIAIGNPLGELGGTVTDGIISALDREITIDGIKMVLLQTNAAVNPGNSGGGLFNMAGELIGIVNAKQSATGIEGLAFAIPIDRVYDDILEVIEDGYIHGRLDLGIKVAYFDRSNAYYYFGVRTAGIYITSATNSQFAQGDRIIQINSHTITDANSVNSALEGIKIGDVLTLQIVRGTQTLERTITVKEYIPSSN